jgi:hypothetical protein
MKDCDALGELGVSVFQRDDNHDACVSCNTARPCAKQSRRPLVGHHDRKGLLLERLSDGPGSNLEHVVGGHPNPGRLQSRTKRWESDEADLNGCIGSEGFGHGESMRVTRLTFISVVLRKTPACSTLQVTPLAPIPSGCSRRDMKKSALTSCGQPRTDA